MPLGFGSLGLSFRAVRASLFAVPVLSALAVVGVDVRMAAQDRGPNGRARNPGLTGWCETPVADRKEEGGCYTTAILDLGVLPRGPIYWHLDTFATRAAAEANRTSRSTVVDSHNRTGSS